MRAAMTGHLVLSTIHTNDAMASIDRLLDIGVEPYLIAGAVRGIISQRLVRKICPRCRQAYQATPEEIDLLGLPPGQYRLYRGAGCSECFQTGYRGRTAVFEILTMGQEVRRAIHGRDKKAMEEAVRRSAFRPILDDCAQLALEGVTTSDEVVRIIGRQVE